METPEIKGKTLDTEGRCEHWHSALDIVAIKFPCCNEFYACYECHKESAGHEPERWPKNKFDTESAVLCGACKAYLTIAEYMNCESRCPHCNASFNPGCELHWGLYFDADELTKEE